ncbi:MAG: cupin domain-containing protein, partial [Candidatus Omnitrophica bacterium]|nr:cupin domain-containing protein [Candidatus Omnitrophota bacterium]
MNTCNYDQTRCFDICWLAELKESVPLVSLDHPIYIRSRTILSGETFPPERHSNCELCLIDEGGGLALVGKEQMLRKEGDLLVYGSGIPHWFLITSYPFNLHSAVQEHAFLIFEPPIGRLKGKRHEVVDYP